MRTHALVLPHAHTYKQELSATGREMILKLIKRKVEDRMTAADSLKHPFLSGVQTLSNAAAF